MSHLPNNIHPQQDQQQQQQQQQTTGNLKQLSSPSGSTRHQEAMTDEPSHKKFKLTTWSQGMVNDHEVKFKSEDGLYIACAYCCSNNTKDPMLIKCQTPFGNKAWIKHKKSAEHCFRTSKGNTRITSFFKVKDHQEPHGQQDNQSHSAKLMSKKMCTGIYDTRNGQDKLLDLMFTYGFYSDLFLKSQREVA